MPSICIISITRLNREQNYCFEFSREHFASERSSSATLKARSDKFWRFHVELSHFELGWSYVEHVVHVPHRSSTLYLASWLRAPLVSLQAPLSVFFALSRLSFFPPRNTPFRTDYRTDYIRKDLDFRLFASIRANIKDRRTIYEN